MTSKASDPALQTKGSDSNAGSEQQTSKKRRAESPQDEENLLAAKRAYNRMNAARHRQRQKELVASLQEKLQASEERAERLERENQLLQAQLRTISVQYNAILFGNPLGNAAGLAPMLGMNMGPGATMPPNMGEPKMGDSAANGGGAAPANDASSQAQKATAL